MTLNSSSEESAGGDSDAYLKIGPQTDLDSYLHKMAKDKTLVNKRLFRLFQLQEQNWTCRQQLKNERIASTAQS